jgi:RHS repeat-associated protein
LGQTSDGGYIVAGNTSSYGAGGSDAWLIKTDASGNQQWSKTFGGASTDGARSVCQTSDSGYILAGPTASYGAGNYDFRLIKTDASGNQQWSKTFGGTSDDDAKSVCQTSDGGYIVAGNTSSYGAGAGDAWLIKTDAGGSQQWNHTFGGISSDDANSVCQTSDGGYVFAGYAVSDMWLVEVGPVVITLYEYDTFGRVTKVIKPGDSSASPTVQYQYNNWGTVGQQHLKTLTKATASDILWQSQYFDGLGRVVQIQSRGETGRTIIDSTTTYNSRGLAEKVYVSQDLLSSQVNGYKSPEAGWKYSTTVYDGLGRVTSVTAADGTITSTDYSVAWQQTVTNPRGYKHKYYYDGFGRLTKVEELDASQAVYATTTYSYDVLGNLTQVVDNSSNTSTMGYNWLSRKTSMSDPDMGSWSYQYDNNGNLTSQTDAKGQTIIFTYDALNRLTGKTYPSGSGMTNVSYTYDSTTDGNYGKGRRTSMTDAAGTTSYKYDARGRLIQEILSFWIISIPTVYGYDSADRLTTITFPNTGETITQTYNGRGLPYTLSSSAVGSLVTGTTYNQLAEVTQINLGNGDITIYGYWGVGGPNDNPGGYYGRLWRIKTYTPGQPPQPDVVLQNTTYTWDANGNLYQRQDVLAGQTETFVYDFLDRLTSVSGPYGKTFTYNQIGNITLMNGYSYTYGSKPHAVTAVGSTTYAYDANGNMTTRGSQTLTWDVENRLVSVSGGGASMSATYDGDGNRVWKTENGQTVLYLNRYFEFDWSTGVYNTHYYLGDQEIAYKNSNGLRYVSQDSLGSTVLTTDNSGGTVATVKYYPYGDCRNSQGYLDTDKRFTGQRLDQTGLYFYNARYYDATIGRFISPDTIVPDWTNPQAWNSYSYCLNNPLKYTDLTGNWPHIHWGTVLKVIAAVAVVTLVAVVAVVAAPVVLPALSGALVGGGSITIGGATTAAVAAYSAAAAIGATMAVAPIVSSIDEPLFQSNDSAANSGLNAAGGHVASTPPNGPNKRDYLLSQVENQKLRNTVDQLYRPGAQVGDGGTADIIRAEETGEHIDKGIERFTNLEKIMMRENLNPTDRGIAEDLYQDLMDALVKTGVPR